MNRNRKEVIKAFNAVVGKMTSKKEFKKAIIREE